MTELNVDISASFKVDGIEIGGFMVDLSSKKYYRIVQINDSCTMTTEYVGTFKNYWYWFKYWFIKRLPAIFLGTFALVHAVLVIACSLLAVLYIIDNYYLEAVWFVILYIYNTSCLAYVVEKKRIPGTG